MIPVVKTIFKKCMVCETEWNELTDFLEDPDLKLIGFQSLYDKQGDGLFLFNHSCRGTLACNVKDFTFLYEGPVFPEIMTGSDECPGYCQVADNLEPCAANCQRAYIREVLQIVKEWPKKHPVASLVG
ncbi:MAG: hypothetical protein HKM93_17255 [Desulfobacteraceae bacterium]|nr:hypothetical protein [Desulfobacteraceae bacterium]